MKKLERLYPRILVVDLTNMGEIAATSRIKEVFFGTWPTDNFRLVCIKNASNNQLIICRKCGEIIAIETDKNEVMEAVIDYDPEVIYYRGVDNRLIHEFAIRLTTVLAAPFVIHLMDDWPERLKNNNPNEFVYFDQSLRKMLVKASICFSIGNDMAHAFQERYGCEFKSFSNAIDPIYFPPKVKSYTLGDRFVIRYTGALAKDMTFQSICDVADVIEKLNSQLKVRLEIFTRSPWKEMAIKKFSKMESIRIFDQVPAIDYINLLQESDALLIAYNFDETSQIYVGYSIANKLPEYLASGTPVIAYGPPKNATMAYLKASGCVQLVEERKSQHLLEEIRNLIISPELQKQLGKTGREYAFSKHNVWNVVSDMHQLLIDAAKSAPCRLVGPFSRKDTVHFDETNCIAKFFSISGGSTMIDVGAHHGSALMPFLNQGWKIFAFEPDEKNRQKLLERLAQHQNKRQVKLDKRAVSNETRSGLAFYRSEESSGVSGLSAFLPSHKFEQTVDTITLTEVLAGESISAVDFLKIDTEGHDLFVLQGFPWERFRPTVIECEFEDNKTVSLGYTFHDLASYLVEKGYTVYVSEWHPIIRYGIRHDWHRLAHYPCELADNKAWGNLIAFRDLINEKKFLKYVRKELKTDSSICNSKLIASFKKVLIRLKNRWLIK